MQRYLGTSLYRHASMYGCNISSIVLYYNAVRHPTFISVWLFLLESSQSHSQFWFGIILQYFCPHSRGRGAGLRDLIQASSARQQKLILPTDFQQPQCHQERVSPGPDPVCILCSLSVLATERRIAVYLWVCLPPVVCRCQEDPEEGHLSSPEMLHFVGGNTGISAIAKKHCARFCVLWMLQFPMTVLSNWRGSCEKMRLWHWMPVGWNIDHTRELQDKGVQDRVGKN